MWYFVNFIVDVVLGLVLNWLFITCINYVAHKKGIDLLISGKYTITNKLCNLPYAVQLFIWLVIVTIVKLILFFGVLIPFSNSLGEMGNWILAPISNNDETELIVVMILVPLSLNIFQFWIQDTILKNDLVDEVDKIDLSPTNTDDDLSYLEIDETRLSSNMTFDSL